jgi:hypothetical protein
MNNRPKIEEIMLSMELTEDQLIDHQRAWESVTQHGSERKLNAIDKEVRDKIGRFYRKLRDLGIYPGPIQDGKLTWQVSADYREAWYRLLKKRPDEYPYLTRDHVNRLLEAYYLELSQKFKGRGRPMLPLIKKAMKEVK